MPQDARRRSELTIRSVERHDPGERVFLQRGEPTGPLARGIGELAGKAYGLSRGVPTRTYAALDFA